MLERKSVMPIAMAATVDWQVRRVDMVESRISAVHDNYTGLLLFTYRTRPQLNAFGIHYGSIHLPVSDRRLIPD